MKKIVLILFLASLISCAHRHYAIPHILIETPYGNIEAELYPAKAPKTVAAFIGYINAGYYKKTAFYRVLKDDNLPDDYNNGLIQGGTWPIDMHVPGIPQESTAQSGLSHTGGTLSLARPAGGSAGTEFFICIGDQSQLDAGRRGTTDGTGYAAFGRVVSGMSIVRQIQKQASMGDKFINKITIDNIKLL